MSTMIFVWQNYWFVVIFGCLFLHMQIGRSIGSLAQKVWKGQISNPVLAFLCFPLRSAQGRLGVFHSDDGILVNSIKDKNYLMTIGGIWPLKVALASLAITILTICIVYESVMFGPVSAARTIGAALANPHRELRKYQATELEKKRIAELPASRTPDIIARELATARASEAEARIAREKLEAEIESIGPRT